MIEVANNQPMKGLQDETIAMLISDARNAILHHATSAWLEHLPILCEGREDLIHRMEALRAELSGPQEPASAATATLSSNIPTHSPKPMRAPVSTPPVLQLDVSRSPIPRASSLMIVRQQIAPIIMGAQTSPLHLRATTSSNSPTITPLLFQSQTNSPASSASNTPESTDMQRATRPTTRDTAVGAYVYLSYVVYSHTFRT